MRDDQRRRFEALDFGVQRIGTAAAEPAAVLPCEPDRNKLAARTTFPAPETDWYVETITRLIVAASCKGFSATTSCAVEQFGLAMMLRFL